jgi:hypothetical protein
MQGDFASDVKPKRLPGWNRTDLEVVWCRNDNF